MSFLFGVRRGRSHSQQRYVRIDFDALLLSCHWQVMGVEKVAADEVLGGGDWLDGNGKALKVGRFRGKAIECTWSV